MADVSEAAIAIEYRIERPDPEDTCQREPDRFIKCDQCTGPLGQLHIHIHSYLRGLSAGTRGYCSEACATKAWVEITEFGHPMS